ncbi:hypothetical protein LTR56_008548 [Elasticomyces elasticus]|nr:hypothetical protein LTR56_008548 [Elasticomyces elasticus]KAK3653321.1 hypothetical protein LTR22_011281 [Elasticomyces elasticus]KAK4918233.1 hypothetical protein LTR49_013932 [Elasticomyces elasticus]KAK5758380.1 hypothetical protein LTS12_011553 [Elasticomyces elasticus]
MALSRPSVARNEPWSIEKPWTIERVLQELWSKHSRSTINVVTWRGKRFAMNKKELATALASELDMLETIEARSFNFNILASKDHVIPGFINPMGGTWIRCVSGRATLSSVPNGTLTPADWAALGAPPDPTDWAPLRENTMILPLVAGSQMMDPAGQPSVMAIYFDEATYLEGGIYWDRMQILPTLRWLNKTYGHPGARFFGPSPGEVLAVLVQLQREVNKFPAKFTQHCSKEDLLAELQTAMRKMSGLVQASRSNGAWR